MRNTNNGLGSESVQSLVTTACLAVAVVLGVLYGPYFYNLAKIHQSSDALMTELVEAVPGHAEKEWSKGIAHEVASEVQSMATVQKLNCPCCEGDTCCGLSKEDVLYATISAPGCSHLDGKVLELAHFATDMFHEHWWARLSPEAQITVSCFTPNLSKPEEYTWVLNYSCGDTSNDFDLMSANCAPFELVFQKDSRFFREQWPGCGCENGATITVTR